MDAADVLVQKPRQRSGSKTGLDSFWTSKGLCRVPKNLWRDQRSALRKAGNIRP